MPHDLERFRSAQEDPFAGFEFGSRGDAGGSEAGPLDLVRVSAVGGSRQLEACTGVWDHGRAEAIDYLRDPILGERLLTITAGGRRPCKAGCHSFD